MAAMRSDNLNMTKAPPLRGFCFPAIRQGYSRDALHQYPCHIVAEQQPQLLSLGTRRGFFVSAIRSGLLGRDVLHDTSKPYTRRALNQIAGLAQQVERLPCKQDIGGSNPEWCARHGHEH